EPAETFTVNLTNPVNATIAVAQGTGTIINDDTPADLSVVKTVDVPFPGIGDTVTYTVAVSYTGPTDATNVKLVDVLPSDLAFVSAVVTQGTYTQSSGLWDIGTLPSGSTVTLTLVATVNPGTTGKTIINSVSVGSDLQNDVNTAN